MVAVDICSNIYRVGNIPEDVKDKASTHMPNIECPDVVKRGEKFKVRIFIKDHPNRIDHYISHIDIYFTEEDRQFNPIHIARINLVPEYSHPELCITLTLRKSGYLHVIAYCVNHGLWESTKKIVVE